MFLALGTAFPAVAGPPHVGVWIVLVPGFSDKAVSGGQSGGSALLSRMAGLVEMTFSNLY